MTYYEERYRLTSRAAVGLAASEIHSASLCTACHPEVLCSYRRDGKGAGRMAAAIRAKRV